MLHCMDDRAKWQHFALSNVNQLRSAIKLCLWVAAVMADYQRISFKFYPFVFSQI